jgi:hypothetical protein
MQSAINNQCAGDEQADCDHKGDAGFHQTRHVVPEAALLSLRLEMTRGTTDR